MKTIVTTDRRRFVASVVGGLSSLGLSSLLAADQQGASPPYVPKQSDRPEALTADEPGFRSIFNGKTLDGWEGDPKYWRAAAGVMTGEITPATLIKSNTFVIWRDGTPKDFELKVDYRITSGGNSGVNYRSVVVPDTVTPDNRFAMRGYQCDTIACVTASTVRTDIPAITTRRRDAFSWQCAAK
jgi:hypothetical protein